MYSIIPFELFRIFQLRFFGPSREFFCVLVGLISAETTRENYNSISVLLVVLVCLLVFSHGR